MSDRSKARSIGIVTAVVVIAVAVVGVFVVQHQQRHQRAPRQIQNLNGFVHVVSVLMNEHDSLDRHFGNQAGAAWRTLDDAERRWLVGELTRNLDISAEWMTGLLVDVWDSPVRVENHFESGRLRFRITSAGEDGRFDTADDFMRESELAPATRPTRPAVSTTQAS